MFFKLNRAINIKGRTVAGENKQQYLISKEDAIFPTVETEAVIPTCVIYEKEGIYVAIIDIPNAFIQTKVDK